MSSYFISTETTLPSIFFAILVATTPSLQAAAPDDWPSLGPGQIESRIQSGGSSRELVHISCLTEKDIKDAEKQARLSEKDGTCSKPTYSKSGNAWVMQTECKPHSKAPIETTRVEVTKISTKQIKSVIKVNGVTQTQTIQTRLGACTTKASATTTVDGVDIEALIKSAQQKNGKAKP